MPVGENGSKQNGAADLFLDVHQPKRRIKLKKLFVCLFLMSFAAPVFATPVTDESIAASIALRECAQKSDNCHAELARSETAKTAFHKELAQSLGDRERHDDEVMRDERLRQQVRQRGY